MVETHWILDNIVPASHDLNIYLNKGYEIVTSQLFSPNNDEVFLAAVLKKEDKYVAHK